MKKIFSIALLLISISILLFLINNNPLRNREEVEPVEEKKQGTIALVNRDGEREWPIRGSEFIITHLASGEVVATLVTDEEGRGISNPLDYGEVYRIEQFETAEAYRLNQEAIEVEIDQDHYEFLVQNHVHDYVTGIHRTEEGRVEITGVYMPIEVLMQKPELPNGCEITSLTAVLHAQGYDVAKTVMSDDYLPKKPFFRTANNTLYGANPYEAFAGDPRHQNGFFVYGPPIAEAANQYFQEVGSRKRAIDVSGSTREEILAHLNQGRPMVIWATLDLSPPRINYSWHFEETHEKFMAPVNLHAYALKGYDENKIYVMDPLEGALAHDIDAFFDSYVALGSHAVAILEEK